MKDCSGHDFELFRISRGEWAPLLPTRLHVLGCPACRSRVAELRNVSGLLAEALSTTARRQPFRRLPVPVASSIIVGGVLAFGSLAHQAGLVRPPEPEAAPAINHSFVPDGCEKAPTPKAADESNCKLPKAKNLMHAKRRLATHSSLTK